MVLFMMHIIKPLIIRAGDRFEITEASMNNPKLSVIFITYNHEKYVRKALDSVLNQETDFDFEVIIGEDCSTDKTGEIVREYASKYPDKIVFVPREKNSKRPTLNVYETTMRARGEYLAYLEGDDYYTDMKKLQKQVDFLDTHKEYIACTHTFTLIDDNDDEILDKETRKVADLYIWSGKFTFHDYKTSGKWPGHYATVVSRNIYKEGKFDYTILYRAHDFVDDGVILLFLLMQGDIFRMDDVMTVWRYVKKSGGNSWSSRSMKRNIIREDCYLTQTLMKWLESEVGLGEFAEKKAKHDFETALTMFASVPSKENWKFINDMFEYNIKHVVRKDKKTYLFPYIAESVINKLFHK